MSRMNRQGFTLIELMVVIVIIGVLASLAIPRFTEASAKAKAAEAPRVLASYESAFLAAVAELPADTIKEGIDTSYLVFETPTDSKWWTYGAANETNQLTAEAKGAMGKIGVGQEKTLVTLYVSGDDSADGKDCFDHTTGTITQATIQRMVPNFKNVCNSGS